MALFLVAASIAGLVVAYMVAPRFTRVELTAARFFLPLERRVARHKWKLGRPQARRPFWAQLAAMGCMLVAFLLSDCRQTQTLPAGGIWILVDTSASMSTQQRNGTRFDAAQAELSRVLEAVRSERPEHAPWFRLSSFDLELRTWGARLSSEAELKGAAKAMTPRSVGTDLDLIRDRVRRIDHQTNQADAAITHVVVITDQPEPQWNLTNSHVRLLWRNVAEMADNHGFTAIEAVRHPLSGHISRVDVALARHGRPLRDVQLRVTDRGGNSVSQQNIDWAPDGTWQGSFAPAASGLYKLQITPADAYAWDNAAAIVIPDERETRIRWELPNRLWAQRLGWSGNEVAPQLRIAAWPGTLNPNLPTLWIADSGVSSGGGAQRLTLFREQCPLLENVNLDAFEELPWPGLARSALPQGFEIALGNSENRVLAAWSRTNAAVLLAGIPTVGDEISDRAGQTIFFNSVRWLLGRRLFPTLYELTDAVHPEPASNRLVLHFGEGDTSKAGELPPLKFALPAIPLATTNPIWPWLLFTALAILAMERALSVWGGRLWR